MSYSIIKCAIIGDGTVGKTTFVNKICNNIYINEYIPTIVDNYEKIVSDKNKNKVKIMFLDFAGQDEYKVLRDYYYDEKIDVFLVMFAINNIISFNNIKSKWLNELETNNKVSDKPIMLIGTKLDVRNDNAFYRKPELSSCVKYDMAKNFADKFDISYCECSSLTDQGLDTVINEIINISSKNINKKACIIS